MTVIIRKLDKTEHEYLAYTKSLCGKATYCICFEEILRAVTLHNPGRGRGDYRTARQNRLQCHASNGI